MSSIYSSKQIFSELNFYSENINEEQQTTVAGDKQSSNIVVTIPPGSTIISASVHWDGYMQNTGLAGNTIIGGTISMKKSTDGAFTNFISIVNKVPTNMALGGFYSVSLSEDNVMSVVNNSTESTTYNVKMASLDASVNGISLSGKWRLSIVINY